MTASLIVPSRRRIRLPQDFQQPLSSPNLATVALIVALPAYAGEVLAHRVSLHSTQAHEDDIREQIRSLAALRDGWLDGAGRACNPEGLAVLQERLLRYYPFDAPELRLYPTVEGTVKAEWWIGGYHVTLEVERDARYAEWSDYHFDTEVEKMRQVSLADEHDWRWVLQRLEFLEE